MLFAEQHFVESTFLPTEGAPKVRVRAKCVDLFMLNKPVQELKGPQQSKASRESFDVMLFGEEHYILFLSLEETGNFAE